MTCSGPMTTKNVKRRLGKSVRRKQDTMNKTDIFLDYLFSARNEDRLTLEGSHQLDFHTIDKKKKKKA